MPCVDILFVLGGGSRFANAELRYALRAIACYATGVGRVFVVGEDPGFLSPEVGYAYCEDIRGKKEASIAWKIVHAFRNLPISDDTAMFNDDHMVMAPVHLPSLPNYNGGSLKRRYHRPPKGTYHVSIMHTVDRLVERGYPCVNYDIHVPILYNRHKFLDLEPWWQESRELRYGYVVKSIYGNVSGVTPGPAIPDCKIAVGKNMRKSINRLMTMHRLGRASPFVSCNDTSFRMLLPLLEKRFPEKSRYEV